VAARSIALASRAVLILDGPHITIRNLRVAGALVVKAVEGARVVIDGLAVSNGGWSWTPTDEVGVGWVGFGRWGGWGVGWMGVTGAALNDLIERCFEASALPQEAI